MIKTELRQGQTLKSGFQILAVKELGEFEACGIWARHTKSGTEVFHVHNNDSENLFSFAFATPPKDSTGLHTYLSIRFCADQKIIRLKMRFWFWRKGACKLS